MDQNKVRIHISQGKIEQRHNKHTRYKSDVINELSFEKPILAAKMMQIADKQMVKKNSVEEVANF